MKNLKIFFSLALIFNVLPAFSQSLSLLDDRAYLFEKSLVSDTSEQHISLKPYFYENYFSVADSIYQSLSHSHAPALSRHLFFRERNASALALNPVFISHKAYAEKDKIWYMQNGLGISLKARHNNRWYADVSLYGFSVNYPQQIIRRADSLGFLPHYGEDFFKADQRCFSYEADWRLSFHPADYIRFETGKSRHFFGMGKRSLFLSDNSASHNFLSTEVKVWKLKYRWMLMAGKDYDLEIIFLKLLFLIFMTKRESGALTCIFSIR